MAMGGSRGTRVLFALALTLPALVHGYCGWTQADEENFKTKLTAGTIAGSIIAAIILIVTSLPVCCGVMKDKSWLKFLGIALGILAAFCMVIPFITGAVSGTAAVNDMCDRCDTAGSPCNETDRENAANAVGALGVLFAYTAAFGFVVVILGIIGASLSCCMCCACCGPLATYKAQQQSGEVTVVGKPVGAGP